MSDIDTSTDIDLMPQFRSEYDEKSLGMLSDILSTLYANPERSVMREYIANAIDAHKIAGVTRPVEVTLPTTANPTLLVQDFGNGLSYDGMKNTFFKYVASTKTNDDSQIGALGIGAKSAFAITKSWTITNVYQGKKSIVASVNDAYGAPMQSVIVNEEPTDDPSGITVSIPINSRYLRHSWASTATQLTRWFPKGSVTFRGLNVADVTHWSDKYGSYENIVLDHGKDEWRRAYERDMYVSMCGIAYSVDSMTKQSINEHVVSEIVAVVTASEGRNRYNLITTNTSQDINQETENGFVAREVIAHRKLVESFVDQAFVNTVLVEAGDIDFMPSRESVKGTPRSVDTIGTAILDSVEKFSAEIVAIRKLGMSARVTAANALISKALPGGNSNTMWTAVGVHDTRTNIYRKLDQISMHALLNRTSVAPITLVTGVSFGTALYKVNVVERHVSNNRGCFVVTSNDTAVVNGFGDVSNLFQGIGGDFAPVMSHDDYKAVAARTAPRRTAGGSVKHRYWKLNLDGEVGIDYGFSSFDELMDTYADRDDVNVYVVEDALENTYSKVARQGVSGIVIQRGRRFKETFVKELGRDVLEYGALIREGNKAYMSKAVQYVSDMDMDDVYCAALFLKGIGHEITALTSVLESDYGDLIPQGHRARTFVRDYHRGRVLINNSKSNGASIFEVYLRLMSEALESSNGHEHHAYLIPDDIRDTFAKVDPNPWALISGRTETDPRTLKHLAVYLAAVG